MIKKRRCFGTKEFSKLSKICLKCEFNKKCKKIKNKSLLIIIGICLMLGLVSAGTTTMNKNLNLKVGDCWNQKKITQIDGLKITWIKGCNNSWKTNNTQQIKNDSSDSPNENYQETRKMTGEEHKSGQMPVDLDNQSAETCIKIKGDGNHNLIISSSKYFSEKHMIDWGKWIFDEIKTEKPYDEFEYTLYFEKKEGDCIGDNKDVRFGIIEVGGMGLSYWGGSVKYVWFDKDLANMKWHFLLFHELGHCFTEYGHTEDNSIMDRLGGDGKFRDYQIETIRNNLR
jgi:hypothetical protein